jgi:hypothetical protein
MDTAKGVSGLTLLPAKNYEWELKGTHRIEVPIRGTISGLVAKYEDAVSADISGEDEFCIYDSDDKTFLMWELVRVLFATAQYPFLEEGEYFNIVALEMMTNINGGTDLDTLCVHGQIIKSIGD